MKTFQKSFQASLAMLLFVMAALVISCSKTADPISGEVAQTANNESAMSSQTSETEDMATVALTKADAPAGRFNFDDDVRFRCATLTFDSASNKESGRVTIDFGPAPGCTDAKGNVRIGKIIVTWSGGRWFMAGSTYVITFSGYSINGVSFSDNDIRTVHNISTAALPLTWTVEASHHLTWPDSSSATRTVHETKEWIRSNTIVDDKFIVSQTSGAPNAAAGTNRHGKSYSVQITVPLEYDRSCAINNRVFRPVKGVKVITFDGGKTLTIDYGDGTCDKLFTITVNGHSRTVAAKNDSSGD